LVMPRGRWDTTEPEEDASVDVFSPHLKEAPSMLDALGRFPLRAWTGSRFRASSLPSSAQSKATTPDTSSEALASRLLCPCLAPNSPVTASRAPVSLQAPAAITQPPKMPKKSPVSPLDGPWRKSRSSGADYAVNPFPCFASWQPRRGCGGRAFPEVVFPKRTASLAGADR
jgi:hypothetical protein